MSNFKKTTKKLTAFVLVIIMLASSMSFSSVNATWQSWGNTETHVDVRVAGQFTIITTDDDGLPLLIPIQAEMNDASDLILVYNNGSLNPPTWNKLWSQDKVNGWWERTGSSDGKEWQVGYVDGAANQAKYGTSSKVLSTTVNAPSNTNDVGANPNKFTINGTLYVLKSSVVDALTGRVADIDSTIVELFYGENSNLSIDDITSIDGNYIKYPIANYVPSFNYCTGDTWDVIPLSSTPFYKDAVLGKEADGTLKSPTLNNVTNTSLVAEGYQFNYAGGYDFVVFAAEELKKNNPDIEIINPNDPNTSNHAFIGIKKNITGENNPNLAGFEFTAYSDSELTNSIGTFVSDINGRALFYNASLTKDTTYYIVETPKAGYTPGYTTGQNYFEVHSISVDDFTDQFNYDGSSWSADPNWENAFLTDFTNIKVYDPAIANITITKKVVDKNEVAITIPNDASFTFTLTDGEDYIVTATADEDNNFIATFEDVPAGAYTITESTIVGDYVDVTGSISVTVSDNGNGTATITYSNGFTGIWTNQLDPFVAIRKVIKDKLGNTLTGRDLSQFSFDVYGEVDDNDAPAGESLGTLSYYEDGLYFYGSVALSTTEHYYVFENEAAGYTPGKPYVEVTVYATLSLAIENASDFINISNDPWDSLSTAPVVITKKLDGVAANGFTFEIVCDELDYSAVATSQTVVGPTALTTKKGVVDFGKLPVGYTYIITENNPGSEITDETESIVVVIDLDGTVTYSDETTVWVNTTKTYPISITKKLDGNVTSGFAFGLYDSNNNLIDTKSSDADGVVTFTEQKAGTYTIRELMTSEQAALYEDKTGSVTVTINNENHDGIYTNGGIYINETIFVPAPKQNIQITKTIDGKVVATWKKDNKYSDGDFAALLNDITFNLYEVGNKDASTSGLTLVASGKINTVTGAVSFAKFTPRVGWYAVVETLGTIASAVFEQPATLYVYFGGNNIRVDYFDYSSKYTIVNGYNNPGRRNVGYNSLDNFGKPVLYQGGNLFYIGVKDSKGKEYASFCANPNSSNFAGESGKVNGVNCSGYYTANSMDIMNGVPAEVMLSALNYIEDNGGLANNRIAAQIVIWKLLIDYKNNTNTFDLSRIQTAVNMWGNYSNGLTIDEKSKVTEALNAAQSGYIGNGKIKDLVYLNCDQSKFHKADGKHDYSTCQPQIVPVYGDGVKFNNKCKPVSSGNISNSTPTVPNTNIKITVKVDGTAKEKVSCSLLPLYGWFPVTVESNANGIVDFGDIKNFADGTYTITENVVPAGCTNMTGYITVTIKTVNGVKTAVYSSIEFNNATFSAANYFVYPGYYWPW